MNENLRNTDAVKLNQPGRAVLPVLPVLPGLDAVRAGAVVAVVALHSGMPYLIHPMPGLAWSVRDAASPTVDFAFWSIELVVMPLFLIIAGFLAAETLARRGPMGLVRNRGKRLLIPLLFGIVVVLPLDLYAWVLGWVTEGLVAPVKLKSLKFDGVIDSDLWGLSHLWFLQYLFQYIVVLAVAAAVIDRKPHWISRFRRRIGMQNGQQNGQQNGEQTGQQIAPTHRTVATVAIALVALAVVVLCVRPQVVWGFQHAFAPVPSKWLYHAAFFGAGVAVAMLDPSWIRTRTMANRWMGSAIAMGFASVLLGQWHLAQATQTRVDASRVDLSQTDGFANLILAIMTSTAAMSIATFTIALAVRHVTRLPRWTEYLAAASFWIYLIHHPILGLVHIDLKYLLPAAPALVKAIAAGAIALAVSLLTYEGLVRRTVLGRWLGMSFEFAGTGEMGTGEMRSGASGSGASGSGALTVGETSSSKKSSGEAASESADVERAATIPFRAGQLETDQRNEVGPQDLGPHETGQPPVRIDARPRRAA